MSSSPRAGDDAARLIAEVEAALAQLLDPRTPAADKFQLEQQLARLKDAPAACLPVLFQLLSTSRSEYALWFASSTLEEYVATKWARFPAAQQLHIRQFVWQFLVASSDANSSSRSSGSGGSSGSGSGSSSGQQVAFVLRKLRKVLADIARVQWRSQAEAGAGADGALWPEFLSQVEALVLAPATRESGLELLCVVAEEFGREDVLALAAAKQQAKARLSAQLPSLLALLANVLRASSHALQTLPADQPQAIAQQDRVAQVALATLGHLLAWAPVAEQGTEPWVSLLFELARNWEAVAARGAGSACASSAAALQCLAELLGKPLAPASAEQTVAEVLQRLVPLLEKTVEDDVLGRATEEYLDKLSELVEAFSTQHLKRLEHPRHAAALPALLQAVLALTTKQPHLEGFLNCLGVWEVFVGYVEEAEQDEGGASEQARAALSAYEQGLVAVMLHLVDRVSYASNKEQLDELSDEGDSSEKDADGADAGDGAAPVDMQQDANDSSYGYGYGYGTGSLQDLAQLTTDIASGNAPSSGAQMVELSERKQFVVDCLALIRRIAALPACAPPLLELMGPRVQEAVQGALLGTHELPHFSPQSESWARQRSAIRDLATHCAVLSSVCAQYYGASDDVGRQTAGWQALHVFLQVAEYLVQHRLHTRGDAFVELQCEVLTSVRVCLSCVPFVLRSGARQEVLQATESVVQVLLHTLDTTIVPSPQVVMQNAMQLLASLGLVLAYEDMAQVPSMAQLEAHIHPFSQHLPLAIQGDLYTSMSNSILNSAISMKAGGGSPSEQEQAAKRWTDAYGALILPIRESIDQSAVTLHQNAHRVLERAMMTQLQRDCYLVRCLARAVETKPKVAKDAFFSVYRACFPSLMALLTSYFTTIRKAAPGASGTGASSSNGSGNSSAAAKSQVKSALKVVNEIVRLYAQLLKSIRREMHKETVADIMRAFVDIFNDAQLSAVLHRQGNAGVTVLCGFLQLLRIVVEEPTAVFSSFLQSILDLCFGPLKETIFSHPESDTVILGYFVALMEQVLEKHYRFFVSYTGAFLADGSRERGYASEQAQAYFVSILQSLASVLSRQGERLAPRVCRQVLALLARVDATQGLFAFAGFRSELRMGFIATLMNLLTRGEMDLLQDEVAALLHRVAAVDFASFFQGFLPSYVQEILTPAQLEAAAQLDGQCLQWTGQVDLPTFSSDLRAFLNDIRVLRAQS